MKGIIILINNEWYFIGKNPYGNNVEENNNGFGYLYIKYYFL